MQGIWLIGAAMLISGPLLADDANKTLLDQEERDARQRQQQELRERTRDLEEQSRTSQQLLQQQDAYLDALREKVKRLKAQQNSESDHDGSQ